MSGRSEGQIPRSYRFPAGVPATADQDGRSIPCAADNLSRTGVLLVGRFPETTVGRLDLTLKASRGSLEVRLSGRVVRVERAPASEDVRVAVQYVDMDDAKRDALEIFLSRLLEPHPAGALDGLKPGASLHDVRKVLESIPLTQRIALAQHAEQRQREILRQDLHSAVLDSLVRNSSLTLPEARAIATSPFLQAGTIDLLAADPRFKNDEELRLVLATHPRVSMPTAEKLAADFAAPQIRKLLARAGLNQQLREKLLRKMTRG